MPDDQNEVEQAAKKPDSPDVKVAPVSKAKTAPESTPETTSDSTKSKRYDDTTLWRNHISAMVPAIEFGSTGEPNENDKARHEIVEMYESTRELNPNRYDGLTDDTSETDIRDNTHLNSMKPLIRLEAFIFAAFIADGSEKYMLDETDLRRALGAVFSVRSTLRESTKRYKKLLAVQRKSEIDARRARAVKRGRIDSEAIRLYNEEQDMLEIVYDDEDKAKYYDVLERMYRKARHSEKLARQDAESMKSTRTLAQTRLKSLENAYITLKKKHEGEAAAERWLQMYRDRQAKSKTAKKSVK